MRQDKHREDRWIVRTQNHVKSWAISSESGHGTRSWGPAPSWRSSLEEKRNTCTETVTGETHKKGTREQGLERVSVQRRRQGQNSSAQERGSGSQQISFIISVKLQWVIHWEWYWWLKGQWLCAAQQSGKPTLPFSPSEMWISHSTTNLSSAGSH